MRLLGGNGSGGRQQSSQPQQSTSVAPVGAKNIFIFRTHTSIFDDGCGKHPLVVVLVGLRGS